MISYKHGNEIQEEMKNLEEVHILLEEDLHNTIIQEEVTYLELVVHREEGYISKGSHL